MDGDGRRRWGPLTIDLNDLPPVVDNDDVVITSLADLVRSVAPISPVTDVDAVERIYYVPGSESVWFRPRHQRNRRLLTQEPVVICDQGACLSLMESVAPPPPPPPISSSFICPICFEPLVNETATKCGHVFCERCIRSAITNQPRCPICRDVLRRQDLIRVYFPVRLLPPPPPQLPTFPCPICLGQVVDATATNCGHIFCNGCIHQFAAINQPECPKCRLIVSHQDIFRIYIPQD